MKLSALSLIFFTSMLIHTAPHAAANISLASTAPLNNWYPQGGSHSNTVALTFNIQNPARKGRVNFRLENTTNWKGYCTNIGTQTGPDLQLLSGDQIPRQERQPNIPGCCFCIFQPHQRLGIDSPCENLVGAS